mmetsp:Transcript_30046/g.60003  ORF Transcript_30046/g.60003 Transcript_30046/m.60003 type:complete len:255 (+) Transcript_30046:679-1443(+)
MERGGGGGVLRRHSRLERVGRGRKERRRPVVSESRFASPRGTGSRCRGGRREHDARNRRGWQCRRGTSCVDEKCGRRGRRRVSRSRSRTHERKFHDGCGSQVRRIRVQPHSIGTADHARRKGIDGRFRPRVDAGCDDSRERCRGRPRPRNARRLFHLRNVPGGVFAKRFGRGARRRRPSPVVERARERDGDLFDGRNDARGAPPSSSVFFVRHRGTARLDARSVRSIFSDFRMDRRPRCVVVVFCGVFSHSFSK